MWRHERILDDDLAFPENGQVTVFGTATSFAKAQETNSRGVTEPSPNPNSRGSKLSSKVNAWARARLEFDRAWRGELEFDRAWRGELELSSRVLQAAQAQLVKARQFFQARAAQTP
ncbi:hypothetical protein CRG98_003460 [Punica granatum]|uniref:Uncharacterized protein n=1 Tax=Punica granatum TaxID=22663 RepID=A0A2I0L5W0_PUNGR|nr:hypothetical protein CRG98_003460 [Punica granatum]